jgi:hypothetical protein
MISEKHSQAARANGARSRGPVTPEGKAISSRNATRHGLLAKTIVLSNEGPEGFKALFDLLVERFSPVDDVELSAIEEMAASYWRLRRTFAMETSLLETGLAKQSSGTAIERTTAVFCDPANRESLALLHRYETRLQNIYHRAIRSLATLRKLPPRTEPPPAEPESLALVPNEPMPDCVSNTEAPPPGPPEPRGTTITLSRRNIVPFGPLVIP